MVKWKEIILEDKLNIYVVPFADFTSFVVPESNLPDEKVLFLSDVLPTAYWSVEHSGMKPGDTVIVLGSGPIGLFCTKNLPK